MKKELELYIHIPFCVQKCKYCDFLSAPQDEETIEKYVQALVKEICAHAENVKGRRVTSVFWGGGTPSILTSEQIQCIFKALKSVFEMSSDAEITIEANPGTVTTEKLETYRRCGINRISFGLQSTDNVELKLLGRIHTYEEFLESFELAKTCGFDNINVDLISAIPRQTLKSWEASLAKVIALNPEHISAYSLIVEEGTPFASIYGDGCPGEKDLPSEDEERELYHRTKVLLQEAGYQRYEISNYAKPGMECKHNLGYWERKDYLGIGIGAASLTDNVRYKNTDILADYLLYSDKHNKIQEEKQVLTVKEQMEEFVFLGLRKMQGISEVDFQKQFGKSIEEVYGNQLVRFVQEGLMERVNRNIRLTERGVDVSNYVFAEFL